jgi:hypothetical protein
MRPYGRKPCITGVRRIKWDRLGWVRGVFRLKVGRQRPTAEAGMLRPVVAVPLHS